MLSAVTDDGRRPLDAELALRFGFLTPERADRGLAGLPTHGDLAGRLFERGLLNSRQVARIRSMRELLRQCAADLRTASELRRRGAVDAAALRAALDTQEREWLAGRPVRALEEILATPAPPRSTLPPAPTPPSLPPAAAPPASLPAFAAAPPALRPLAPPPADDLLDEAADYPAPPPAEAEPSAVEGTDAVVAEQGALRLRIAKDRLTATLELRAEAGHAPSLADAHRLFQRERVQSGLIDEATLARWIAAPGAPLVVARGEPPVPGEDARIDLAFDPREGDPVTDGARLAVRVPMAPGRAGRTIHGRVLPVKPPRDVVLRPGPNARLGPDGCSIVAAAEGCPCVLADGRVCVFPVLRVDGDVGPSTGNLATASYVQVAGNVEPGYRVACGRLDVSDVSEAEIETEGDVLIRGAGLATTVRAGGTVRARSLRRCRIEALGDVHVGAEMIECEIRCSGRVYVPRGRLVACRIIARQGVEALGVGSERSAPCHLQFGVDPLRQGRLNETQGALAGLRRRLRTVRDELTGHMQRAAMRAQERAAAEEVLNRLAGELQRMRGRPAARSLAADFLRQDKRRRVAAEEQAEQEAKAAKVRDEAAVLENEIRGLRALSLELRSAIDDDEAVTVRVEGLLRAGSLLVGRHARLEVPDDHHGVTATEVNAGGREAPSWQIALS